MPKVYIKKNQTNWIKKKQCRKKKTILAKIIHDIVASPFNATLSFPKRKLNKNKRHWKKHLTIPLYFLSLLLWQIQTQYYMNWNQFKFQIHLCRTGISAEMKRKFWARKKKERTFRAKDMEDVRWKRCKNKKVQLHRTHSLTNRTKGSCYEFVVHN